MTKLFTADESFSHSAAYMDDIGVWSRSAAEHLQHVRTVLQKLREAKLYAKKAKCIFGRPQAKFLGHVVSRRGVAVNPDKINAVQAWPTPTTKREVQSFNVLANFYRRFVKGFSQISLPLSRPAGKDTPWEWTDECQRAFDALKTALTTTPVLKLPDPDQPMIVHTDASDFAVGAVLSQGEGDNNRVVSYASRKLNGAETRYPAHDKEALAVHYALIAFRHHLLGSPRFKLYTDSIATKYLLTKKDLTRREVKWVQTMSDYDFEIYHISGSKNVPADALSRRPDLAVKSLQWIPVQQYPDLLTQIKTASGNDPEYARVLKQVTDKKRTDMTLRHDMLYKDDRIYIPAGSPIRQQLLEWAHDVPMGGHQGRDRTLALLNKHVYWPRLPRDVQRYVQSCPTCQTFKHSNQRTAGLLQPLTIPAYVWDSIGLDFVTHLPKTFKGHTSIVVFVDRLSKMMRLAPTNDQATASDVVDIMMDTVVRHHGMPRSIVSDRDPRFMSELWQGLFRR
jgi:hypothetical protein